MRVKKHCNCPTEELDEESYKGLLFEAMVMANKDKKERSIVFHNGNVSHINKKFALDMDMKIYAHIPIGLKTIKDVEHLDKPF